MATVPDPSEGPQGQNASVQVPTGGGYAIHPNPAGELLPRAIQGLASSLGQAGELYGKTAALQSTNDYLDQTNKILYGDPSKPQIGPNGLPVMGPDGKPLPDTGFYGKSGQAAMDARPAVQQQLEAIRQSLRGRLWTQDSLNQFDEFSRKIQFSTEQGVGTHAEREGKVWAGNVYDATLDKAINQVVIDPTNPVALKGAYDYALTAAKSKAALDGFAPGSDAEAKYVRQAQEKVITARVGALGALDTTYNSDKTPRTGPEAALVYLDSKKDVLGADWAKMHDALLKEAQKQQAIGDAGDISKQAAADLAKGTPAPGQPAVVPAAAPGAPSASNSYFIGDSIGDGLKSAVPGAQGRTQKGVSPQTVQNFIASTDPKDLQGKTIYLSTGASNAYDAKAMAAVQAQIQTLIDKGVDPKNIRIAGVGDRADFKAANINGQLADIAAKTGAVFTGPLDPTNLRRNTTDNSDNGVHAANWGQEFTRVAGKLQAAADAGGYDPATYHARTVQLELGNKPLTTTNASGHMGPVQASGQWWNEFGAGGSPFNLNDSIAALDRETQRNQPTLTRVLGREPSNADLYLAHQQGLGGAVALLTHPNANVIDALAPAYGGNRATAMQAVLGNGGSVDMTAGQFAQMWADRYNGANPGGIMGHGQTMVLPTEVSGSAPANNVDFQGAPQSPATSPELPPVADPAAFSPKQPEGAALPPGPEDLLAKSVQLVNERTDRTPEQKEITIRLLQQQYAAAALAAGENAKQVKARKDKAEDDVYGLINKGQYTEAFARVNQLNQAGYLDNKEVDALREVLVKRANSEDNPASLGPGFTDMSKRITLPTNDPNRIGSLTQIYQAYNDGLISWKGVEHLSTMQKGVAKSEDEFGFQKRTEAQLDQAKRAFAGSEDPFLKIQNPKGLDKYDQFVVAYMGEVNNYKKAKADGTASGDFELFDPKKFDAYMQWFYPKQLRDHDALGGEAKNADVPGEPMPAPSPGMNPVGWQSVLSVLPVAQGGIPWSHKGFAQAVQWLYADPSPEHIAAFNDWMPPQIRAEDILKTLQPQSDTTPARESTESETHEQRVAQHERAIDEWLRGLPHAIAGSLKRTFNLEELKKIRSPDLP